MKHIIKHARLFGRKSIPAWLILAGCSFYFSACVKDAKLFSAGEGNIYMPQAYADKGNLTVYLIDSPQTYYFGIAYGGFKSASQDITANFEVDTSLIAQYNTDNAYLGKHYVALPDTAYSISGLSTVLKSGTTSSEPLALSVKASKLHIGTYYLLPVKLTGISAGNFDTALSVTYFRIDSLYIRTKDITNQGTTFTFNYDDAPTPAHNDAKESAIHLVDNDYTTKYLLFTYHTDMYVQLEYPTPTVINAYTLTSGGDAPERDPKDWNLAASNDGKSWTVIDSRSNQIFPNRTQTIQFNTSNNTAYQYYRLNITANNNNNTGLFQCTEWRLLQYY